MKQMFTALLFGLCLLATQSKASFVNCNFNYEVTSAAVLGEFGTGTGTLVCQDVLGQEQDIDVRIYLAGAGLKLGYCKAQGSIQAYGVGFTFETFASALAHAEAGVIFGEKGNTYQLGGHFNPNINLSVTRGETHYSGWCVGLGSVQGMLITRKNANTQEPSSEEQLPSDLPS